MKVFLAKQLFLPGQFLVLSVIVVAESEQDALIQLLTKFYKTSSDEWRIAEIGLDEPQIIKIEIENIR